MDEDFSDAISSGPLFFGVTLLVYGLAWITRKLRRKSDETPGGIFQMMVVYALVLGVLYNSVDHPGPATTYLQGAFFQLAIYCFIAWIVRGMSFDDGVRHANWLREKKLAEQMQTEARSDENQDKKLQQRPPP
jgi:uncharacterized membrane protein HdeD (DUF308 family)